MKVIFGRGKINVPSEMMERIMSQVQFILGRFNHRIRVVRVRVDDLNGTRGGIDKHCLLEAGLIPRGRLVAEVSDSEVLSAVRHAARVLARRIREEFDRSRDLRRRTKAYPLSDSYSELLDAW